MKFTLFFVIAVLFAVTVGAAPTPQPGIGSFFSKLSAPSNIFKSIGNSKAVISSIGKLASASSSLKSIGAKLASAPSSLKSIGAKVASASSSLKSIGAKVANTLTTAAKSDTGKKVIGNVSEVLLTGATGLLGASMLTGAARNPATFNEGIAQDAAALDMDQQAAAAAASQLNLGAAAQQTMPVKDDTIPIVQQAATNTLRKQSLM
ncbi:hypothetical protein THASP1DRAFT_29895 [Thamnocephalis sphaerospora]|uniref:Hydrophobic surface binding protein A-domain-containing protein n=1 Tax=Thamnocephalis sphaerospora TaxID=78915 RepID=A0A4P9XQH0_9FUNG|nr:hypothetical protein THASP1DRAFT_29895 [Thamnocephalis sphaerospora]|eukprot:RKP08286.1 hypothetical protein THASP1DRAFT_29895 [Thamnocephalis sphaerospora]